MKLSIKSFVSLCAVFFLTSGLAIADLPDTAADFYVLDGICGMLDEWGHPAPNVDVEGNALTEGVNISANSANGNVTLICSQDMVRTDPKPRRSVIYNYDNTGEKLCGTLGGATADWHQIISASGKAKLTCHVH